METIDYKEVTIIDVRESFECKGGMVEGAINIPLGEVPRKIKAIKKMKAPLVLCCRSGARSGQAVEILKSNGIVGVHNGGSWKQVNKRFKKDSGIETKKGFFSFLFK